MNTYKYQISDLCKVRGWDKASVSSVWLLFTEEVGELASAIRQYHYLYPKKFKKSTTPTRGAHVTLEMGDVFGYLFQLAYMMNVDLDEMWNLHQRKLEKKIYHT
jgi:NTP pyrophosphatase (non-canonical NTP hydrolase)